MPWSEAQALHHVDHSPQGDQEKLSVKVKVQPKLTPTRYIRDVRIKGGRPRRGAGVEYSQHEPIRQAVCGAGRKQNLKSEIIQALSSSEKL